MGGEPQESGRDNKESERGRGATGEWEGSHRRLRGGTGDRGEAWEIERSKGENKEGMRRRKGGGKGWKMEGRGQEREKNGRKK